MSLIRDPATITKVGRQMMTAGGDITYTKATLYGQDISHLTKDQLESLTSIGNPLLTVPVGISDKSDNGNGTTVVLEATFQNSNLKADLPYTAVGFFAKKGDGDEKLVLVGVANPGTYLVATPPDGIATDAADIKAAIAIGDATSVTAVVDPAGSVTPATLNGAINKLDHDLTARIDVKADKTTVESVLATKANQSDLDQTNAEVAKKANSEDVTSQLATKANSSDVAASVKSLTDSIATKADAKTVNDAISKIDFTPYAKTADVDSKLQSYTNTADLTKLLDVKANAVDVYSKTELDKKLLALSTDTDGKVNVDQVSSMIANKVDKSDLASDLKAVNDSIATKANSSDVNTALAKKDDTTDVDAKIKTVTDLANTKANANDVYNRSDVDNAFTEVRGRLSKLEGTQTLDSPDFNGITASGVYYITNNNGTNIKNNPVDQWGVLIVSNGDGHRVSQVYYPDDDNPPWYRSLDESTWRTWYQLSTRNDVNNAVSLANKAQDTANQANTNISKIDLSPYAKSADVNSELANKASTTDVANANNNANGRLPLGGGNMTLRSTINWNGGGIDDKTGNLGGLNWAGGTDWAKIYGDQDDNDNLDLAFDLGDDGSNHVSFRKNGSETSAITSDGHFTGTVDWSRVNGRPEVTPVINGSTGDDLFAYKTNQLRLYPGNGLNCKNLPPANNTQWFTVQYVFEAPNNDGIAIFRSPGTEVWINGNNGGSYGTWKRLADSGDITDLRNQIQQLKDNQFEVQTFTDATAAANWEAQKPGHRLAIVNK